MADNYTFKIIIGGWVVYFFASQCSLNDLHFALIFWSYYLQCFDTVDWVAGRASGGGV